MSADDLKVLISRMRSQKMLTIGAGVGVVVGGYALTSIAMLKKPIFDVRLPLVFASKVKHISHRGGAGENIENTMSAFRHAVRQSRTDMLEIDVHLTKDKRVVVSHDHHLLRQCGRDVHIGELNYAELPPVSPKVLRKLDPDCAGAADFKIPLLEDVFCEFPRLPVNIDIKHDSDELIEQVSNLIKKYDREEITVWGNFSDRTCRKCLAHNPNIPMLFSIKQVLLTVLLFYTGLLPFVRLKPRFFEVVMPAAFAKLHADVLQTTRQRRVLMWLADKLLMRRLLFEHLRKRGVYVFLWVVNEPDDFELAFSYHCNGVMTDFPTRLRSYLDKMENQGEVLPAEDYEEKD